MMLTFLKGRKPLPVGTIRIYNGLPFRKVEGGWVYASGGVGKVKQTDKKVGQTKKSMDDLEKGRKATPDGTLKEYPSGLVYQKQGTKWVYYGKKSDGKVAQALLAQAGVSSTAQNPPPVPPSAPPSPPQPPAVTHSFKVGDSVVWNQNPVATATVVNVSPSRSPSMVMITVGGGKVLADPKDLVAAPLVPPPPVQVPNPPVPIQQNTSRAPGPIPGLETMSKQEFQMLREQFTTRRRMGEGQQVTYVGNYWRNRRGQTGKLVAIGDQGYAMVQFSDGKVESAAWADIKATGAIVPNSIYDKIDESRVYRVSGDVKKRVDAVMNQKIGNSKMTYLDLCHEFQKRGFNLQVVGGTLRDIVAGKDSKDVDFIFNGTDRELFNTVQAINPAWVANAVTNKHIGLCSFNDGGDVVDITPIHKYSPELNASAKGWNLADDASSRDLAMNTIQLDPLTGIMTDATGNGISDTLNKTLNFNDIRMVQAAPVYLLRVFKFITRGYVPSAQCDADLKKYLYLTEHHTSYTRKARFMKRQIGEKDGVDGLRKFKEAFRKYDAALWDRAFQSIWSDVVRSFGGRP